MPEYDRSRREALKRMNVLGAVGLASAILPAGRAREAELAAALLGSATGWAAARGAQTMARISAAVSPVSLLTLLCL